nr:helix-turn-helix domain-containing protein [Brevibacillus laterosporus]
MARINVFGYLQGDDELTTRRNYHTAWRDTNSLTKLPFFALFKGFKEKNFLANLDPGALRLYLYFGFVANNHHGDSWHSVETIAEYFGKQTRTIDTWISELVKSGLIYRTRDNKKSNTTFLIPYTDTLVIQKPEKKHDLDNQDMLNDLLTVVRNQEQVYGRIIKVYHIFHWGSNSKFKKPSTTAKSGNFIFIITKRENDVLVGHFCRLKKSDDYGISKINIQELAVFNSPFKYDEKQVPGIAVEHIYKLTKKESYGTWLNLLRDLAQIDETILEQHPEVEYGLIEDVYEPEDDEEFENDNKEE